MGRTAVLTVALGLTLVGSLAAGAEAGKGAKRGASSAQGSWLVAYRPPKGAAVHWSEADVAKRAARALSLGTYEAFKGDLMNRMAAEVNFKEAMAKGLASSPAVQAAVNRYRFDTLSKLYLEKGYAKKIPITRTEIDAEVTQKPEAVIDLNILVPNREEDIPAISKEIRKGASFEKLVERYGSETTRNTRGKFARISEGNYVIPPEERDRVYALPVGKISPEPVKLYTGPAFVQITWKQTREESRRIMRQEAEERIRQRKFREQLPKHLEELKKTIPVEIYLDPKDYSGSLARHGGAGAKVGPYLLYESGAHTEKPAPQTPEVTAALMSGFTKRINEAVLAIQAEKIGLDKDEGYRRGLEDVLRDSLWTAYKNSVYRQPVKVDEAELRRYFEKAKKTLFWRVPYIDAARFRPVEEAQLSAWAERVAGLPDDQKAREFARANSLQFEERRGLVVEEMDEALREAQKGKSPGQTFSVREGESYSLYLVVARGEEDYRPTFEQIREGVEQAYRQYRASERLTAFVKKTADRIQFNEARCRAYYERNAPADTRPRKDRK